LLSPTTRTTTTVTTTVTKQPVAATAGAAAMDPAKMENFMNGPLLKWLRTLPESPAELRFSDLTSGPFLHNVLQSFDVNILSLSPREDFSSDYRSKVSNLDLLIKKLKSYYEDVLNQCLVVALPDPLTLCQDSPTPRSLAEMDSLLLLILGAAVQCSQKEHVIGSIKNLPTELQHEFVEKIQEVTDNPNKIWNCNELDNPKRLDEAMRDDLYSVLIRHLKRLVRERDDFAHRVVEITIASPQPSEAVAGGGGGGAVGGLTPEKNHLALEVAESKAKIRRLNQQLEERTEGLSEAKEDIEKYVEQMSKFKHENLELAQEARAAKAFRDELDIIKERANKVDRLEAEMQRYKDKVADIDFFKSRVDELREDNRILIETKDMLEEQLDSARKRGEQIMSLENDILRYKTEESNHTMERENDKRRIDELTEENYVLQMSTKSSFSESHSIRAEMQVLKEKRAGQDTNILTEQIDKDVTRIHKLELENARLLSELEDLKVNGFKESSARILELEKANKKQEMSARQSENLRVKDSESITSLEKALTKAETNVKRLENVVATMREEESQLRIEKDTEVDNLTKQVDSMRQRQEQGHNEQIADLDKENTRLVKERTTLETEVSKLLHDSKRLVKKNTELEACAEAAAGVMREKEKLNSRLEELVKETEDLALIRDTQERATENMDRLKEENSRFNRNADKLRTENTEITIECSRMKSEMQRMTRRIESLTTENHRIPTLESERDDLKEANGKLKLRAETLSGDKKKTDELEKRVSHLISENSKLARKSDSSARKLEDLSSESVSLETENQKLQKTIETMKATTRKVDQLEKDNNDLENGQIMLEREHKSLTKEVERMKHVMEVRDANIDELHSNISTIEREKSRLQKDLKHLSGDSSKLAQLEQDNRKLVQECTVDKRNIIQLRESLVEEKLKSESHSSELEATYDKLKKLGIDQSSLDGEVELVSNERMKNLEGSMSQLLEARQKKIASLETALKGKENEKSELQQSLEFMKLKIQSGDSKAGLESELAKVVKERNQAQGELINLKMEVEGSKDRIGLYEDKMKKLHEEMVNIQVENSTLQSQSSSLLSQINQLQITQGTLETSKRKAEEEEKRYKAERTDLLRDQAGLQKLHDQLQTDYDALLKEREAQKDVERLLKTDLRKLQSMSLNLSEDQNSLIRAKEAIDLERENLRTDARTLANLRSEHARLKDDFRSLFTSNERIKSDYCTLQTDYKALKTSFNTQKLSQTEMKGELHESKSQMQALDVEHSKALNRCEVLAQMNLSLEEDRKNLMSQVSILLTQYHDLLTQTLDDKEHFHEEERVFTDRMNNLARQKEKLEEKIMEQYRKMENSPQKKVGFGGKLVHKMRKASSNLIPSANRSSNNPAANMGSNGSAATALPLLSTLGPNSSSMRSARDSVGGAHDSGLASTGDLHHDDSSSVGSGSLDSGQNSPAIEMSRSEFGSRKMSNGSTLQAASQQNPVLHSLMAIKNSPYRKGFSTFDDSDGNNADNDSVNSVMSSGLQGFGGQHRQLQYGTETDSVSTLNEATITQSISSHSDIGIPVNNAKNDSRQRMTTRVYVNGVEPSSSPSLHARSTTPKLAWKQAANSNTSSPIPGSIDAHDEAAPPTLPARKQSSARAPGLPGGSRDSTAAPQLPPKPGRSSNSAASSGKSKSPAASGGDESSSVVDDDDDEPGEGKNAEWYEYGCV